MNELDLPSSFGSQSRQFVKRNDNLGISSKKQHDLSNRANYHAEITFNKSFSFYFDENSKKNICKLPEACMLFQEDKWQIGHFQELKTWLNNTKSKLNDLNLKEWHLHTTNTNVAGDVMKKLRYSVCPEFLTQAWCKMYECLMSFWLVPEKFRNGVFNSVHLCEAPGAFITALNHFLQTWYPEAQWNWLATTLNPYHEGNPLSHMIQDDRFILHTLPYWTFGEDGTGNLMDMDNLRHLQSQVQTRLQDDVMLVTADGSIDCQINPAEQEALVAPLHYCETLTALTILKPGGSFLLKMFTFLECDSICLLYLLVCVFDTVNVFKPVKSKEGNSEVYVLCTDYVGKDHLTPWMPTLLKHFGPTMDKAMFSERNIPEEFKFQVSECAKMFTILQTQVIERNLDMFFNPSPSKQFYSRLVKKRVAEKYLEHYNLHPVSKAVVGNNVLADTPSFNLAQKYEEGTFNDRLRKACQEKSEHVEQLWASLQDVKGLWPFQQPICWFMFNNFKLPALQVTFGQPVMTVASSKFCNGRILEVYSQLPEATLLSSVEKEIETYVTVDVREFPWETCSSHCHQLLLERLSQKLQDLPPSKSLCVQGLPLLTQFSVSVVFLLAHSFYQVGLSVEGNVILCGYRQACSPTTWIQCVLADMQSLPLNKAVLSILPVNILCDKSYCMEDGISFYLCVTSINNQRLVRAIESEVLRVQQSDQKTA